jgi:SAM-dependent methyltransferase
MKTSSRDENHMSKSMIVEVDGAQDFYWGILPREEMARLVARSKETGHFEYEVQQLKSLSTKTSYMTSLHRSRSLGKSFSANKDWKVLEVGTGYGQITVNLAQNFGQVFSIDATKLNLEFTECRVSNLGLTNVTLFHVPLFEEDFLNHPKLKESKFDLIVLNGVLEWVGSGIQQGHPRELQSQFLKKLSKVLNRNGILYLAIENRLYPKWWTRDPHTKQAFVTILPRVLANTYSKMRYGSPYRNFIYSHRGILKLLLDSEFSIDREVLNFYSYRDPRVVAEFYDYEDLKEEIKLAPTGYISQRWKILLLLIFKLRLPNFITPSFSLIFRKKEG